MGDYLYFIKSKFLVKVVHQPYVDKDQNHEHKLGALLGKPKAQAKPSDLNGIQLIDQQYTEPERYQEPNT